MTFWYGFIGGIVGSAVVVGVVAIVVWRTIVDIFTKAILR